jgi:DNA-binding response OmpR family regulator
VALCDRSGEEIALANDLAQSSDIDRRRHRITVAGKPRSLTATHWQIFVLLYRHRGDVVSYDRIHVELFKGRDWSSAEPFREHMRQLRKALAGSRYQIVNYHTLGYELIVANMSDAVVTARPPRGNSAPKT